MHAESLGLRIAYRNLGRTTGYLFGGGLVILNHRHHLDAQRETLAHECGHAFHGHNWNREHDQEHDERQADQYAARILIPPSIYAAAERLCGADVRAIAQELHVTRRLVELRREDFARDARVLRTVEQWRADTWAS